MALSMVLLLLLVFSVGWSDVSMGVVALLMVGGVGGCDCNDEWIVVESLAGCCCWSCLVR